MPRVSTSFSAAEVKCLAHCIELGLDLRTSESERALLERIADRVEGMKRTLARKGTD